MTNPLSDKGWSDRDFAAAVGVAMGETGGRINRDEMAGVIDVLLNRKDNWEKGKETYRSPKSNTIEALAFAPGQFDATNRRGSKGGRTNFNAGWNAVLSGKEPPANQRARYAAAIEEVIAVANGTKRGIARNADFFSKTNYKMSKDNARIHDKLGRQSATKIGGTSFYGDKHKATGGYYAGKEQYGPSVPTRVADVPAPAAQPVSRPGPTSSAAGLNFGPDFTSPPSQARGPVENPYGFSNVNTAQEAVPGSFAGYGPNAFGALDQAALAQTYPEISAGLYPTDVAPARPMSNEDFNAIFGDIPDDATGSVRNAQMSAAAPTLAGLSLNAPIAGGPYGFSSLQSEAPAPNAATIPNDVTGFGAGSPFGSRAPAPAFDFADIVNNTQWSGAAPANAPAPAAQPAGFSRETPVDYGRTYPEISSGLYGGPAVTAATSPFSPAPLGMGHGLIDQGPFSTPIGPTPHTGSFSSPIAVDRPAPSRSIVDYETKTITKDVPNPAWSEWSRDYATKNAAQDAWLAADEDKALWDRAPPNPSVLANTSWAFPDEPPKTIAQTTTVRSPVYGDPVRTANVPAVNAQPASRPGPTSAQPQPATWSPGMTAQANAFSSMLAGIGSYGLQGVPGTFGTGFDLAGLGGGAYGGYGNWGGGYSDSGYGGYGGTAPGDAGYGSDARSGSGNMGAGNLYQ